METFDNASEDLNSLVFLLSIILAAHLLCMNIASAGPLMALWLDRRAACGRDSFSDSLGKKLLWWSMLTFVIGMLLGLLQGLMLYLKGDAEFFQALNRFWDTKIYFGFWELAFYAVCLFGYIALWQWGNRSSSWQIVLGRFLAVLAATNLLYHFPILFAVISAIVKSGNAAGPTIHAAEFRGLMGQDGVGWLAIHFALASFAVVGLWIAWMLSKSEQENEEMTPVIKRSGLVSMICSVAQLPVGLAFLLSLPSLEKKALMGGNLLASGIFLVALMSALFLMHLSSGVALHDPTPKQIKKTCGVLVITVFLMTLSMLAGRG